MPQASCSASRTGPCPATAPGPPTRSRSSSAGPRPAWSPSATCRPGAVRTLAPDGSGIPATGGDRSGLDVPLLAGVVELGPLADHRPAGGFAVLGVQDHAVADVADGVVAAHRG